MFHGASLYAGLRVRSNEKYLLVVSDPDLVGMEVSQIVDNTMVTASGAGGFYFEIHTGSEMVTTLTYALNGSITVAAQPIPKLM